MVTINLKTTLICLVFVALIIFIVYLTILVRNLIQTIKQTNVILEDATVVSGIAADKATEIDGMVTDVKDAVSDISHAVKGNQNIVSALSNIAKAIGSLVSVFKGKNDEKNENKHK